MHNAVELYLDGSSLVFNNDIIIDETEAATPNYITTKYNWSDEDTEKFVQSVNNDKLIQLDNDLDMLLKVDNIDSENVEVISARFCEIIDEAANVCNMKKNLFSNPGNKKTLMNQAKKTCEEEVV